MLVYKTGDLLKANEPVIAHGCNCEGKMGAGIAKQIKAKYLSVYLENKQACDKGLFVPGSAQPIYIPGYVRGQAPLVYNLGTQPKPGPTATLSFVYLAFWNMLEHMKWNKIPHVAIPRIGAGYGGLDWTAVQDEICNAQLRSETFNSIAITVYSLEE